MKSSTRLTNLRAALLFGLALACCSHAALASVRVVLQAKASVDNSYVRLADVARIEGTESETRDYGNILLGRAPLTGQAKVLRRWDIRSRLLAWGADIKRIEFDGADQVRIRHQDKAVAPATVAAPAKIAVPAAPEAQQTTPDVTEKKEKNDDVVGSEKNLKRAISALVSRHVAELLNQPQVRVKAEVRKLDYDENILSSATAMRISDAPKFAREGRENYSLELLDASRKTVGQADIQVDIAIQIPAVFAKRDLERGMLIDKSDLYLDYLDLNKARQVSDNIDDLVGQRMRTALRAGYPVRDNAVEIPALVERGALVTVEARHGHMVITQQAQAMQAGIRGDVIMVKNTSSKESYPARVIGPNKLVLH